MRKTTGPPFLDVETPHDGAIAEQSEAPKRKLPAAIDFGVYSELDVALDPVHAALWCLMRPKGPPSFTPGLLQDLKTASELVHRLHDEQKPGDPNPVRYWVVASDIPGIFNLGGDLNLFLDCIRANDRARLRQYAHACVEATYRGAYGMNVPCISIAVVEGDALGGGFEAAISGHVLIAERGVRMGMPEVLFNTFPGMGAYSFLSRKLDAARAEKMILGGKIYSAEQLYEIGIVDILAEPKKGREAARQFMTDNRNRHSLLTALDRVRKRVHPLTMDELRDVTDIWVETTMKLGPADLRKMAYLTEAQARRAPGSPFNLGQAVD